MEASAHPGGAHVVAGLSRLTPSVDRQWRLLVEGAICPVGSLNLIHPRGVLLLRRSKGARRSARDAKEDAGIAGADILCEV